MRNLSKPTFKYEKNLWRRGFAAVCGVDEVGRGAWAGPIVAAACAFAPQIKNLKLKIENLGIKINDSKQMKPRQRELADKWIKSNAMAWGIGEIGPQVINRLGMAKASKMAFRRAIVNCNRRLERIDYLLIDAFYIPYVKGVRRTNQLAITRGDQKSFSIAAASIIAKVYRDKIMRGLNRRYPGYGWGRNKGYGTRVHQEAIKRYGITRVHRRQFVATWRNKFKSFEL